MKQPYTYAPSLLQVMMVTEYMQGGDLGLALAKDNPSNRRLSWYNSGSHIALCIARGLAYLHAQKASPISPSLLTSVNRQIAYWPVL